MKEIVRILLVGCFLLAFTAKGQNDWLYSPPVLGDFQLSDQVKTVKEECHSASVENDGSFSELREGAPIYYEANSTLYFDANGRMFKQEFHSDNPSIAGTDTYEYTSDLLEKVNNRRFLLLREYDTTGLIIRNKIKMPTQGAEENSDWRTELPFTEERFFYDEKARVNRIEGIEPEPEFNYTYIFEYDASDNVSKVTYRVVFRASADIERYWYDAAGNLIKWELEYENEGPEETKIYEYSNNVLSTLTSTSPIDALLGTKVEKYSKGLIVSKTITDYADRVTNEVYEYQFDEKGNWIRKIIKSDSHPDQVFVLSRTIEYF